MKYNRKIQWKKITKWFVIILLVLIVGRIVVNRIAARRFVPSTTKTVASTVKVEQRDIEKLLSSSGTVKPKNTYEVKTLAEGEIIASNFEEGDYVEEGQVLYQIATDTLDNKIETSETAVERARKDYDKSLENYDKAATDYEEAKENYEKASKEYGDPKITSEEGGIIKTLFVKEGDRIQNGSQIAELYDNSSMLLEIPFNASEAVSGLIGKKAKITISGSMEILEGKVTKVSSVEEVLSGNRLVRMVTIQVPNPGGLTTTTGATAAIGDIYSSSEGTFQVLTQTVITSKTSGVIETLKIEEGSRVEANDVIYVLDEDSVTDLMSSYQKEMDNAETQMENAKDNIDNAQEKVEDTENSLQEIIDSKTDYSVKAPISGQVITKKALTGDTINNNTSLCTIYDLSSVKFDMYIDELDVLTVKAGQEVIVTADALEGIKLKGTVTNISLESTANQGVTQYPVTVMLEEKGDLLPGMNVTGEIILEQAKGVLTIPSDALMRGDMVYVKDESVKEAVGNIPAGYRAVKVETGITDGDYIEIKSGLTGDEEIYVVRVSGGTDNMMTFLPGAAFRGEAVTGETRRPSRNNGSRGITLPR